MRKILVMALMVGGGVLCGCAEKRQQAAATAPVTDVDPRMAEKEYWLEKPGTAVVQGDFDSLWDASEEAARKFLFRIDRRDQRSGLLTTEPMISKQFFELWRKDAGTAKDVAQASLQNIRRTIYFQFQRESERWYSVIPKVVVEQESKVDPATRVESDLPMSYWYALRRDEVMEGKVAEAIRKGAERHRKASTAAVEAR